MTYEALDIADEIMRLANKEKRNITQLKLIKLCYFVQGWSLGVLDKKMFNDEIQAWMHGPVIPKVYHKFKYYNGSAISYEPKETNVINERDKKFIKSVWETYKTYDAFSLRDITHQKESPWKKSYDGKLNKNIEIDIIKNYYKDKYEKQQKRA